MELVQQYSALFYGILSVLALLLLLCLIAPSGVPESRTGWLR